MIIRNNSDVRLAYFMLNCYRKEPEKTAELKRKIREYLHREPESNDFRIVKDYGIDGFISLEKLPEEITDYDTAVEWFEMWRVRECVPSQYDCTGQLFTNWFKVFKRNGSFWAYHSIGCDV